jgi:multidrug resistance efflux pump
VTAFGAVSLVRQAQLTFGSAGTVGQVLAQPGEEVRRGQVFARLEEAAALEAALRRAEAAYNSKVLDARASVRNAEVALENARRSRIITQNSDAVGRTVRAREAERNFAEVLYGQGLNLFSDGEIDQAELDKRLGDLLTTKERLEAARQNASNALATAQNNVAKAEDTLRKTREALETLEAGVDPALERARQELAGAVLTAPFFGVVEEVAISAGMPVRSTTAAITLVDPSVARVIVEVDESEIAAVTRGQKATVTLAALADADIEGTVEHVGFIGKTKAGLITFLVTILLPQPLPEGLRSGMSALVEIAGETAS